MKLKTLICINHVATGIVISSVVAFMTWIVMRENDFLNICSQVFATVLFDIGVVIFFSYQINYLISQKIKNITCQLDTLAEEEVVPAESTALQGFCALDYSVGSLEKRFENSTNRLVQTNSNFSEMIRSLAHDIRTPMMIIQGYVEEMEDGIVPQSEYPAVLKIMRKEIDFVTELSTHAIKHIYTCNTDYQGEVVFVKQFMEEELFPLLRPRNGIEILNGVNENFEMFMDKFELKQALLNVLHNASKFTYEGQIKVYSKYQCLVVEDSGIGIGKMNTEDLFQPFVKQASDEADDNSGLGLGLSISRNLLNKYGYEIRFDKGFTVGARIVISQSWRHKEASRD